MIHNCDDFIFLDDVQYNRRSWQNRTYIKSYNSNKRQWLSMSLKVSSRELNINEAYLIQENLKYFRDQLYQNYKRAKFFDKYYNIFNEVLSKNINADLSSLNINIIEKICSILKIDLKYKLSSSFNTNKKKENLILDLLNKNNSTKYLANTGSIKYAGEDFFKSNNIIMKSHNYIQPTYKQLKFGQDGIFLDGLSIIDVLFNIGEESINLVKKHQITF